MNIFISRPERGQKITQTEYFIKILTIRWKDVVIQDITDTNRPFILEWKIEQDEDYLNGKLDREEDMIVFEFSNPELATTFAVWAFRNLLNKDNIILYDDSYSIVVPLADATTLSDVAEALA